MRKIVLGETEITDESSAFVIAEIGNNHQGNLESALALIRAAAEAGANSAKFQKRNNQKLYTPSAYNEIYNSENSFGSTYGAHRDALEFGKAEYEICISIARECGIEFFATAFDFDSADFLQELGVGIFKIASGDLQNLPLLKYVAKFNKPMIVSTGGSTWEHIDMAVKTIQAVHNNFAVLQCTASYPASFGELNLRVIQNLRERYPEIVIGYSGHDNGIAMPIVAYSLGARIIEKHFTLNRTLKGTDHAFSLEPQGMRKMVRDLKRAHIALGDGEKRIYESERAPIRKMGKMIIASRELEEGHTLSTEDFEYRSPADGLPPSFALQIVGRKTRHTIKQYAPIHLEDLL